MPMRGIPQFYIENLVSHSTEKLRRGALFCVTNAGIEKFYASEGYVKIFCQKVFVSQCQKFRRGTP